MRRFLHPAISVESASRPPFQFNALDNRSAPKVDFFAIGPDEYDRIRLKGRLQVSLLGQSAFIARPEDAILYKLRWYKLSPVDRQLTDIASILRVSNMSIDQAYLTESASKLNFKICCCR